MEGYGGRTGTRSKRKFERDKDTLREYGVPIELEDTDVWAVEQGYRIRKEAYYLPEIAFTPEEITALFVAAQSGTRGAGSLGAGVRKLLYGAEGGVLTGLGGGPLVAALRRRAASGSARGRRCRGRAAADASGSGTATPAARRSRSGRSTRTASCSAAATGTWWATIVRTRRDPRVPPLPVHDPSPSTRGRGARLPRVSRRADARRGGPVGRRRGRARRGRVRARRRRARAGVASRARSPRAERATTDGDRARARWRTRRPRRPLRPPVRARRRGAGAACAPRELVRRRLEALAGA